MKWILNGTHVTPRNVFDISLDTDWTGRPSQLETSADKLELPREANDLIHNWISTYGPFQGMPLQAVSNSGQVIEYYVDLMEKPEFQDYQTIVTVKRRKGKDNFFDNADGTSFELMASDGVSFSKIDIPYIIVKDNALELALTLGVTLYVMTKDLISQIQALTLTITNIVDSVTPEVGAGVTADPAEIATLVIKALLQIALIALTLTALIKLSQQFFELIFPKVRNFQGTKVQELIQKGCQYLGYTLQSNLLQQISNFTVLPVPLVKAKASFWDFFENDLNFAYTKGYPTSSDSVDTLGSLIRYVEETFNAKTWVNNGVVEIERRDYKQNISSNQVLTSLAIQDDRQNSYTLNTEDAWKRTLIKYQIDSSDLHTLDFFDPTDAEFSTEVTTIANPDLVSIKGLNKIDIPFALGVRKNKLNWLEEFAKEFFEVVDQVLTAFGGNGDFSGKITDRVGVLQVSQQFFVKTKMLYTIGGKQPADYVSKIKASAIYNTYHKINEIQVNDYKVFEDVRVRMNSQDFVNLLNNNFASIDGLMSEILKIQFFEDKSFAVISYKQPFNYADGKVFVKTINS